MALPDLTGQNIQDTYQKVVQTDGNNLADGTGSLLPISFDGNNVIISGSLTATEYSVTSSVTNVVFQQQSGSTIFGDSLDDTHQITGSLHVSGTITASRKLVLVGQGGKSGIYMGDPTASIKHVFGYKKAEGESQHLTIGNANEALSASSAGFYVDSPFLTTIESAEINFRHSSQDYAGIKFYPFTGLVSASGTGSFKDVYAQDTYHLGTFGGLTPIKIIDSGPGNMPTFGSGVSSQPFNTRISSSLQLELYSYSLMNLKSD